jgi:hypothetical protein
MSLAPAEINIKNHIIKYPDLFQSRMDVLKFILLRDPESCWGEDGTVYSRNISREDTPNAKISTEHLGTNPPELAAIYQKFVTPQQVYREIELAKYQVMEKHFDVLVKSGLPTDKGFTSTDVRLINEYSKIFQVPDNVEASWLAAVREVLQASILATKEEYLKHGFDGSQVDHWVYPFIFETYQKLMAEQKRFMPKLKISPETAEKLRQLKGLLG